jgi:succinyl-CoA synthetase alpha subunit
MRNKTDEWVAKKYGGNWHVTMNRPSEPVIAWVAGMNSPHAKANAHLLAASPKLMATLERLLGLIAAGSLTIEHGDKRATLQDVNKAHALINRAKGGHPDSYLVDLHR